MTDILSRIDDTLTFHSAGLGVDLEVPVERDDDDLEIVLIPVEADTVYRVAATITTMESLAEQRWRIERTSCGCGGNWAWYRQRPSGAWECQGCVCHSAWTLALRATG